MIYYSATNNCFFFDEIHGDSVPSDAVEITKDEYLRAMNPPAFSRVVAGADGKPSIVHEAPPKVQTVTMRQARLALLAGGYLQAVQQAIENAGDAAKIEWEYAATVERESPIVAAMAQALGLDDAALDALFTQAAGL